VAEVLHRHGQTYAAEAGIRLEDGPSPLFQLLCLAVLLSARIRASVAVAAMRALRNQGWTTPRRLADSTWEQRAKVLNESHYRRYDERTATMLAATAELILDRYQGDLRRLRDAANRDPSQERKLLEECKGIGNVGVDIFFREVQNLWSEVAPFFGDQVLDTARTLGLPGNPRDLAGCCRPKELPRLAAGLLRTHLAGEDELDRIRRAGND
jgi:hypothetical protein